MTESKPESKGHEDKIWYVRDRLHNYVESLNFYIIKSLRKKPMLNEELLCFEQTDYSTLRDHVFCLCQPFFFAAKCTEHISPVLEEIIPISSKLAQPVNSNQDALNKHFLKTLTLLSYTGDGDWKRKNREKQNVKIRQAPGKH